MRDNLGDLMKIYENVTRYYLPKKSYYILRVDGRAFHSLCRDMERPFDVNFVGAMDAALMDLCEQISGTILGYAQSDEISLVFSDLLSEKTETWFGGNIQKIASVSASIATAAFNKSRSTSAMVSAEDTCDIDWDSIKIGHFDSRVYALSDIRDVNLYFEWRNLDCTRNAISMAAQSMFSHNELQNKSSKKQMEMMLSRGMDFNDYPSEFRNGRVCVRKSEAASVTYTHKRTNEVITTEVIRDIWEIQPSPVFSCPDGKEWLANQLTARKNDN